MSIYRIDIEDTTGTPVAVSKNFLSIDANIKIAEKGDYQLLFHRDDPVVDLIEDDFLIRLWRVDPVNNVPWTNIFTGIHKTFTKSLSPNGRHTFTSYGPDSHELIQKAYVLYPLGSTFTDKSGAVESVMYDFVNENITANALAANGRDIDHVNPVTLSVDNGTGPVWTGRWARKNLLEALQALRQYSISKDDQVDFEMVYLGDYQWQFNAGKIFVDRTTVGLVQTTGLNGAGEVPIMFGPQLNNVYRFDQSKSRYNEVNTVVIGGQQTGTLRSIYVAYDVASATVSPIAQRENVSSGVTSVSGQLPVIGDAELEKGKARTSLNAEPRLTSIQLWRDFYPGDFVTLLADDGEEFHKQVTSVSINISGSGGSTVERVGIDFSDI